MRRFKVREIGIPVSSKGYYEELEHLLNHFEYQDGFKVEEILEVDRTHIVIVCSECGSYNIDEDEALQWVLAHSMEEEV